GWSGEAPQANAGPALASRSGDQYLPVRAEPGQLEAVTGQAQHADVLGVGNAGGGGAVAWARLGSEYYGWGLEQGLGRDGAAVLLARLRVGVVKAMCLCGGSRMI